MKTAVFNFSKPSLTGTIASNRIAHFLADTIKAPLVWDESIDNGKLDVLFLINGSFQFCKCLDAISSAILKADRIVWVQNDYNILPPKSVSNAESNFRKAFVTRRLKRKPEMLFWTTVMKKAEESQDNEYINWNSLAYEPLSAEVSEPLRRKASKDLFYYGAYRQNRIPLFDRYFIGGTVPVTISSSAAGFAERYGADRVLASIKRDNFYHELASHGLGLYIEDTKSSKEFHSPANRFYEMLSAGLPMVFQPEAAPMLKQAGIDITGFTVAAPADIPNMMRKRDTIAAAQRQRWDADYRGKLTKAVKAAYRRL